MLRLSAAKSYEKLIVVNVKKAHFPTVSWFIFHQRLVLPGVHGRQELIATSEDLFLKCLFYSNNVLVPREFIAFFLMKVHFIN